MIRVALRGLAGRKLRAFLTGIAIVLGVAMVSGTFVLTDAIDNAFKNIFSESYAGTDAVVSGKSPDINFNGDTSQTPSVPDSVLPADGRGIGLWISLLAALGVILGGLLRAAEEL